MNIKPMLGEWEIPRIAAIETLENRAFVELDIPGKAGSLFQDMNSRPTRITLQGSLYGEEKRNEFLEAVRERYRAGEPVTFVADILTATEVQYVVIESMYMEEVGTQPDQMEYHILLRESPPPPPPPDPLGGIDTGLLDDAGDFLDSITGVLDVIDTLGNIPDFGDPTGPLKNTLEQVRSATEGLDDLATQLTNLFGSSPE
jgi:hypothetical protein